MKTTLILLMLLAAHVATAQQILVKGRLADSARVILADMRKADTVWAANGQFRFERSFAGTVFSLSFFYPRQQQNIKKTFIAADGEVNYNGDSIRLNNTSLQNRYYQLNQKLEPLNRIAANLDSFYKANKPVTKVDLDRLNAMAKTNTELKTDLFKHLVSENKQNAIGAYVLYRYLYDLPDLNQLDSLVKTIDPEVAKISYPLQQLQKELAIKMSLLPGHIPPVLAGTNINGRQFTSVSLKGKYALLDFWGTWCVPCISGLPKMKAAYEKYKDRITFVSIACHDKEPRWRATVTKQNMTWTQLLDDPKDRIVRQFYVENFPTKILIGPDGKVIQVFKGEGDDFYKQLDKLLQN